MVAHEFLDSTSSPSQPHCVDATNISLVIRSNVLVSSMTLSSDCWISRMRSWKWWEGSTRFCLNRTSAMFSGSSLAQRTSTEAAELKVAGIRSKHPLRGYNTEGPLPHPPLIPRLGCSAYETALHIGCWFKGVTTSNRLAPQFCGLWSSSRHNNWVFDGLFHRNLKPSVSGWQGMLKDHMNLIGTNPLLHFLCTFTKWFSRS